MNSSPKSSVEQDAKQWWIAKSGKHHGPFTKAKMDAGIRTGKIDRKTLICTVGGEEWIPAADEDAFRPEFEEIGPASSPNIAASVSAINDAAEKIRMPKTLPVNDDTLKYAFRYLLFGEITCCALSILLTIAGGEIFADVYPYVEPSDLVGLLSIATIPAFVFLLPAIAFAWFGLFRLKNWARWLYLSIFVIWQILFLPFATLDYSPSWSLVSQIAEVGAACTGAILALAFLSPLADSFKQNQIGEDALLE